jgi:hypothetical protein
MFVQDDQIRFARRDQRAESGGLPLHVPYHAACRSADVGYRDSMALADRTSGGGMAALGLLFHPDSTGYLMGCDGIGERGRNFIKRREPEQVDLQD